MNDRSRQMMLGPIRHVHMVGIGGIGMSSIAEVLLLRGFTVSGSDLQPSNITDRLVGLGATIAEGHDASNVGDADVVVYSSAVHPDENPETLEAERRRIPLIRRDEMLGELMRMKYGIGIAGTHGKTTTTSMTGVVVSEGGFDPTVIVGGKVAAFDSNAVSGEGDIIVIEADEYDRTFLRLTPVIAVVTTIEEEHLDIYRDLGDIKRAFTQYANSVPFFGAAILCLDEEHVQSIIPDIDRRVVTYGTSRQASIRGENIEQLGTQVRFTVVVDEKELGTITLSMPGLHNVRNALAAVAVGLELEIPFDAIARALTGFEGVHRRFELKGSGRGILVVDDYGHHPTEIMATLEAASQAWPERRLVVVFQPHLYSRTLVFKEDFGRAFFNADVLVVTDIYPARETPIEGIDGSTVADAVSMNGHRDVRYVADKADIPDYLSHLVEPGDVVLTLGAGDIWRRGEQFVEEFFGEEVDRG
ncbi:MAG: UDP-N-acetylmuramate--L-alanine ligase [Candidatus Latescibacterota bacterium]|jgi:UDP-N-acetylmuramate--alanine ligase